MKQETKIGYYVIGLFIVAVIVLFAIKSFRNSNLDFKKQEQIIKANQKIYDSLKVKQDSLKKVSDSLQSFYFLKKKEIDSLYLAKTHYPKIDRKPLNYWQIRSRLLEIANDKLDSSNDSN